MLFWIIVAVLTAAVAVTLLMPLMRAGRMAAPAARHDVEVYRDQLDELKRDAESGLIPPAEAALARAEVARRLLAVSDEAEHAAKAPPTRANRLAQAAVITVLPLVGLCLYLTTGSPALPDAPLSARLDNPGDDIEILVARAERQLADSPDDGAGWDVLAPIYYRGGRFGDARAAYENAIRLNGPSPQRLGGYAESLIAEAGGLVPARAQEALQQSLALQPDDPRARFYLALALEQAGKAPDALAAFREIARAAPPDAPWLPLVDEHVARLTPAEADPKAPGNPTQADIASAEAMTSGDRRTMIEGMVSSLASKLADDPRNLEGWLRIVRSYTVLGDRDKATTALRDGLAAFPPDTEGGRRLLALGTELGLDAERTP